MVKCTKCGAELINDVIECEACGEIQPHRYRPLTIHMDRCLDCGEAKHFAAHYAWAVEHNRGHL